MNMRNKCKKIENVKKWYKMISFDFIRVHTYVRIRQCNYFSSAFLYYTKLSYSILSFDNLFYPLSFFHFTLLHNQKLHDDMRNCF